MADARAAQRRDGGGPRTMNDGRTEQLREIIAETLDLDPIDVPPDASAKTLAPWTSLAHLRLMANIERAFGVRFATAEIIEMTSITSIERVLAQRRA